MDKVYIAWRVWWDRGYSKEMIGVYHNIVTAKNECYRLMAMMDDRMPNVNACPSYWYLSRPDSDFEDFTVTEHIIR